jgi:hypothetical protein
MARKTQMVVIEKEGRDFGKVFMIREKPAYQIEMWALRFVLALGKAGAEISDDVKNGGFEALIAFIFRPQFLLTQLVKINPEDARLLLGEMMECVTIVPNPAQPAYARQLIEDDTEEVSTLAKLKTEVFALHANFSLPASGLKSTSGTGQEAKNT